ncbi:MAG TPA: alpha/beta fold hydrolase [Allosphingosinicella sp.]
MFKGLAIFAAVAAAAAASAQQSAQPAAPAAARPATPAERFGVRESVSQIDISPDGRHVVYLQPGPGRSTIAYISDLDSDAEARVVVRSSGNPERLRFCNFVTNDRLICRVSGMTEVQGVLIPFSRLVSLDTNGANIKMLGQTRSYYDARLRQFDGAVLDWLPGGNGEILMSRELIPEEGRLGSRMMRTANGLAVDRIDVRTLASTRVEAPNRNASWYLSDGRGNVRIMAVVGERGSSGQLESRTEYSYRTAANRDWQRFGASGTGADDGIIPLAVDPTRDAAYVLKRLNGRLALYRVKLDGSMTSELVYANPRVDVDDVVWSSRGSRVIGVSYVEEQRRTVYFDPEFAALARSLGRAIPNLPLIDFGGTSADGNRILIHAGSDSDPGRYYVYDKTARNLSEILVDRPQLEGVTLANVRAITYPAADGTLIPAYLTLPPGREGRNLPTVILPHGGPASRDEWGFDWLAQYLANQGYAVLQPNYRGSAGFGDQWLQQNGYRSWRTSIGDIAAGARWMAAQGTADANRMAILGWSYGGYAALQAGATEPSLFKAIVAIAPVTDLQQAKDDAEVYSNARNVSEYIGSGPHIVEGSPIRQVRSFTAPVLLFHGDRDINVPVIHSQTMDQALRDAGKRSELVRFAGLEHDLADTNVRVQMLDRIGAFLQANLGR